MDIKNNRKYSVLTENGFKSFTGIKKTLTDSTIKLHFSDGSILECTKSHLIKCGKYFVSVDELFVGDIINDLTITSITNIIGEKYVYDLLDVDGGHEYITNNVTSHNCAFVENWDEFYKSVYPTISSGTETKVVFTSCVPTNTLVYTSNGLKYVGEFVNDSRYGGYYIPEYTIQGHTKTRTSNIFHNNGIKKTKILRTTSGDVESTLNHKFWAYKSGVGYGKYESKDLGVGDYISSQAGYNLWGNWIDCSDFQPTKSASIKNIFHPEELTPEICYFLGLYIAEGNVILNKSADETRIINATYTLTCGDDLSHVFNSLGIKYSCHDGIHYNFSNLNLMEFMQYLGFDLTQKAKTKTIPSKLLTTTKENISALLRGMFDGDGCIVVKNGQSRVSYVSTSNELVKQVKMLLLNFGIFSSTYDHTSPPTEKAKVWSYSKVIELSSRQSMQFNEEIGFGLKRKSDRIIVGAKLRSGSPHDVVPDSYNILKKCGAKVFCGLTKQKTPNLSRHKLIELKDKIEQNNYYDSEELRNFYSDNVSKNIRWELIKEVDFSENETYDFSLMDSSEDKFDHSVIYNGFIGFQTPNGLNHYYKLWEDAVNGNNDFIPIKVTWEDVPGRDLVWKEQTIANTSMEAFIQEHEAEFIGSSGTLIDGWKLKELVEWNPIKSNKFTRVYEEPISSAEYVICCDVSRGRGIDDSAFSVIKISSLPYKIVATYTCDNIPPDMYAEVIYQAYMRYNKALVLVENNDAGCETLRVLNDTYECETILGTIAGTAAGDKKRISINGGQGFEFGIRTTKSTKAIGCARLKVLIENNTMTLGDKTTINQLNTFSRKGTSYEAEPNCHDDTVMTLVMFSWLTTQDIFTDLVNINTRQEIRNKFEERFEDELVPFGYIYDGVSDTDENTMNLDLLGYSVKLPTYDDYYELTAFRDDDRNMFIIP